MNLVPRCFLHLSDLHFGRHDALALNALYSYLETNRSEIERLLITGDFTQRARNKQFTQAARFIEKAALPVVAVPGNHDVPLYNLWRRLRTPYKRYERHLNDLVDHEFEDDEILILGLRTTDVWTVQNSRFTQKQAAQLVARFQEAQGKTKILLLHHPLSESSESEKLFLESVIAGGANVVLSGHGHQSSAIESVFNGRKVLLCSAGTSISDRLREENNSFNKVRIESKSIRFETLTLNVQAKAFQTSFAQEFTFQRL